MGKKIGRIVPLLLSLLLYAGALECRSRAAEGLGVTWAVLTQGITGTAAETLVSQEAQAEEPVAVCFWGELSPTSVSCPETGRARVVTPVALAGHARLLGGEALTWRRGCLVDEKTAQDLFGTAAGGQSVLYAGEILPVLGTVEAARPTLLVSAEADTLLNRAALELPPADGARLGSQALLRWELAGEVPDGYPLWALAENLLLLFPLVVVLRGGALAGRRRKWLGWLCGAAGIFLLSRFLVIPAEMLPSKWSDFEFWGRLWESQRENALALLAVPPGNGQLHLFSNMVQSELASIGAALAALWPMGRKPYADTSDRG